MLPSGTQLLLLEGVGSSREVLAHLLDSRLWVQADRAVTIGVTKTVSPPAR